MVNALCEPKFSISDSRRIVAFEIRFLREYLRNVLRFLLKMKLIPNSDHMNYDSRRIHNICLGLFNPSKFGQIPESINHELSSICLLARDGFQHPWYSGHEEGAAMDKRAKLWIFPSSLQSHQVCVFWEIFLVLYVCVSHTITGRNRMPSFAMFSVYLQILFIDHFQYLLGWVYAF